MQSNADTRRFIPRKKCLIFIKTDTYNQKLEISPTIIHLYIEFSIRINLSLLNPVAIFLNNRAMLAQGQKISSCMAY